MGTLWERMGTHGNAWERYGNAWERMGTLWERMGTHGNAMGTYGNTMGTHGNAMGTLWAPRSNHTSHLAHSEPTHPSIFVYILFSSFLYQGGNALET